MYGVVLWSDAADHRAVFWCEDHGDLAIYVSEQSKEDGLHAGDLVEFDVRAAQPMRCAYNARLVSQDSFHQLPESLLSRSEAGMAVSRLSVVMADGVKPTSAEESDEEAWEAQSDEDEDDAEEQDAVADIVDQPCASNVLPFRFTGRPRKRG